MVSFKQSDELPILRLQQVQVLIRRCGAAVLLTVANAVWAGGLLTGRVVGLADGDTITVLDAERIQHKVRVAGIDAPEKGQPFGNRSKAHLSLLVMGRAVEVEWHKKDRYRRIVGLVRVNGKDAGLEQVRAGMAWHYVAYSKEQTPPERELYATAQDEAKAGRRGLWADRSPQPPWDFRTEQRPRSASRP